MYLHAKLKRPTLRNITHSPLDEKRRLPHPQKRVYYKQGIAHGEGVMKLRHVLLFLGLILGALLAVWVVLNYESLRSSHNRKREVSLNWIEL